MQEVAGVNISAVVQQISGDLNRRSKMERGLSAFASRMNQVGVGAYEFLKLFEHAQACGGMRMVLDCSSMARRMDCSIQ